MLSNVVRNVRRGNDAGRLFELANVYLAGELPLTELPEERSHISLALWGEGDFFDLKGAVEALAEAFDIRLTFVRGKKPFLHPGAPGCRKGFLPRTKVRRISNASASASTAPFRSKKSPSPHSAREMCERSSGNSVRGSSPAR